MITNSDRANVCPIRINFKIIFTIYFCHINAVHFLDTVIEKSYKTKMSFVHHLFHQAHAHAYKTSIPLNRAQFPLKEYIFILFLLCIVFEILSLEVVVSYVGAK